VLLLLILVCPLYALDRSGGILGDIFGWVFDALGFHVRR
jgi:hypothetical protein